MEEAKKGDTVAIHYTGRLEDGTVFDSSRDRDPLRFTLGEEQVIPGFETAVEGMAPGQQKTETIPPERAYGPHREDLLLTLPREKLPEGLEPEVGQQLQMRTGDGRTVGVVVTETDDRAVQLDANHPLAGKQLTFEIELVEIG